MDEHKASLILINKGPKPHPASWGFSKRALMSAAGGAALLICEASAAWADCTPSAANSVTAICSGTTTTAYGTGVETNGTITVNAGAFLSIANADLRAIDFASIKNLYNYGAISVTPTSVDANAYGVSSSVGATTLDNYSSGSITATSSGAGGAWGVAGSGAATVHSNAGSIIGNATGTPPLRSFAMSMAPLAAIRSMGPRTD